jgi:putative SOS response-associated peptidase YedK
MCGRYAAYLPPDAMADFAGAVAGGGASPVPSWNVAPSQIGMVLRVHPETGRRHIDGLQWGLLPHYVRDLATARRPINARAETVATTGMFRDAFLKRRCLVLAQAFYEWQRPAGGKGARMPFAIARADGETMAMAAIWEGWRNRETGEVVRSFAVITTEANALMAPIHDRMPVIVEKSDWPVWLGEEPGDYAALMRPAADGVLKAWPVSPAVGNPRIDGPELLMPRG